MLISINLNVSWYLDLNKKRVIIPCQNKKWKRSDILYMDFLSKNIWIDSVSIFPFFSLTFHDMPDGINTRGRCDTHLNIESSSSDLKGRPITPPNFVYQSGKEANNNKKKG
jgi:hypothetical protein